MIPTNGDNDTRASVAEKVIQTAANSIISIDEVGTILFFNPAAERMLGYSRQEIIGENIRRLMPSPFRDEHDSYLSNYLTTGIAKIIGTDREVVVLRKDGTKFPADLAISEIHHDGARIFTGVLRDLTERKHWESQIQHAQKLESLGVLAGGIAHDFNNLLMGVLGHASLILQELRSDSPLHSSVHDIQSAALRASDLCKQMLAYSGKGRFVVQPLSLSEVVEQFGHLLEISIPKNVILRYELCENIPAIQADASQMQQLVMNLITNAAEAVGDSSGIVTLATGVMTADKEYLKSTYLNDELPSGDYAYYEVSDTGCGMTEVVKQKLFDPFFSTKFTGRGLGLAALLGIVRGHSGAVKVYSEIGKGTTIKVLFPAIEFEAISLHGAVPTIPEWQGEGTVLVVDDDETARTVSKRFLESGGFTTLLACDGMEGIEMFQKHQSEIVGVLLDMTMPLMDGVATFQRMKQINSDVKVILTSGYNEQDATSRFAGKELAGFIQKPYQPGELLQLMCQMLEGTHIGEGTSSAQDDSVSTILVVDDEEIVRSSLSGLLTSSGFVVHTASNGKDALDLYRFHRDQIALVVLDRNLKGMSGEKVLAELKEINPNVKVALCSGSDLNIAMSGNQLGGAVAIIPKLTASEDLLRTIRFLLEHETSYSK